MTERTKEEQFELWKAGFSAGMEHQKPSRETELRLKTIEDTHKELKEQISELTEIMIALKDLPKTMSELNKMITSIQLENAGNKPFITIVGSIVTVVLSSVVGALIYSITSRQ